MSQSYRLESGGKIDRAKPLSFTFNGKSYGWYQGDTLASALIANGVKLVGRSFKYHRPRGFLSAGSDEPNAVVQLEEGAYTDPNTRATVVELYDGLKAASQNCWPSVNPYVGEINSLFARFLLQDLHVAAQIVDVVRRTHPSCRRYGCVAHGIRPGQVREPLYPL